MTRVRLTKSHWSELSDEVQSSLRQQAQADGLEIEIYEAEDIPESGSAADDDHEDMTDGMSLAERIAKQADCCRSCEAAFNKKDAEWRKTHSVQPGPVYYKFVLKANESRINCLENCQKKYG